MPRVYSHKQLDRLRPGTCTRDTRIVWLSSLCKDACTSIWRGVANSEWAELTQQHPLIDGCVFLQIPQPSCSSTPARVGNGPNKTTNPYCRYTQSGELLTVRPALTPLLKRNPSPEENHTGLPQIDGFRALNSFHIPLTNAHTHTIRWGGKTWPSAAPRSRRSVAERQPPGGVRDVYLDRAPEVNASLSTCARHMAVYLDRIP